MILNKLRNISFVIIKEKLLSTICSNNTILDDTAHLNMSRIFYLTLLSIPIRILDIVLFSKSAIAPFLITCVAFGIVFLIRPFISITMFLASYIIYYNLIVLTITDHQVLLSNRVNGITAVALGLLISIMNWHYNYLNITQKNTSNCNKNN